MASRGHQRERAVRDWFKERDWVAFRPAGSFGVADVVALKRGYVTRFVQVKSTAQGPYEHFGPADRAELVFAAEMAGATPVLAWWPARGELRFIGREEWPR